MEVYRYLICELLSKENVYLKDFKGLNEEQKQYINELFEETIFPVLTPIAVDAYRPFPTLLGKTLNLLVMLEDTSDNVKRHEKVAIVQVPSVLDRFIEVPYQEGETVFVLIRRCHYKSY